MKKSALLAIACAAMIGSSAMAQTQEITYVEDPAQGYTFNRFKDNWFITAEGGVNYQFSRADRDLKWSDRFAPAAGLYVGKWFSPLMGFRGGFTYMGAKGLAAGKNAFGLVYNGTTNGPAMHGNYYKTYLYNFGINFDAELNVTNWWCGYKPYRVYNFIAYVGGVGYFGMQQKAVTNANGTMDHDGLDYGHNVQLGLRGGFINSFNVSKQVALALDIRYTAVSAVEEPRAAGANNSHLSALLSLTYNFKNRVWTAPVVPVCPELDYTIVDNLKAQLADCENKRARVQKALEDCEAALRKPAPACPECDLATVYFTIGSANVNRVDANVLKNIASIMKTDGGKYDVIGWADNNTGSAAFNVALREKRANAVKRLLVRAGVPESQLNVSINNENRKGDNLYLDRCVTISKAK